MGELTRVCTTMCVQVTLLIERLATVIADMGAFTRVNQSMKIEMGGRGEGLTAAGHRADVITGFSWPGGGWSRRSCS